MSRVSRLMRAVLWVAPALAVTGCAVTDTSRYYALGTFTAPAPAQISSADSGVTIGVGPIAVPGYLDRPHVVTRDAADGLEIWTEHRWAEPLELGIAEALATALSGRVPSNRVAVFPWRGILARSLDYQVVVAVARFEGSPGRSVTLDARWRLLTRDGKELAFKRTTVAEPISGDGFAPLIAAMNRSIDRLGEDIGEAIQAQSAKRAARTD